MPPRKAPWISLFVRRSCWSPVHTHNCLLSRGQFNRSNMQMPSSPAATHGLRTGYWMLRSIWPYVHIGPQIFRFRLRRAAPSVQNTPLHSSKPGFICSETIFCISFRFAGFVLQICKNAAICGQHVRRASRVINGINIPSWPGNLNISSSADAAFLAVVKGKKIVL